MRATLADVAGTRNAGRFVWLELDFDKPVNAPFLARRQVGFTPTLLAIDGATERTLGSHIGPLTSAELTTFLDAAERAYAGAALSAAAESLSRADELLTRGEPEKAVPICQAVYRTLAPGAPERPRAIATLARSLWNARQAQPCAELAASEAPGMPRGPDFGMVVLAGSGSCAAGRGAPWAVAAWRVVEPLAEEAVTVPTISRDCRFQIYQNLEDAAAMRGDDATARRWGHAWLDAIEAIVPSDDDARAALDIARCDAVLDSADAERVLPALLASEKAMPRNYNTYRLHARIASTAGRPAEALAACEHALALVTGPQGRAWVLEARADALLAERDTTGATRALQQALVSARTIGSTRNRENEVRRITRALAP